MLNTRQKVLRDFWYATVLTDALADGPKAFRLLGQDIVLFLDKDGLPAALEDRCCHRTAKLSKGWINNGNIVCGYHGWEYNRDGKLVMIPQFPFEQPVPEARAKAFHAKERYGYVWVCLGEPISDIPDLPYEADPGYRRIQQFYDRWNCSALRLMENSFDNAHFSFVHKGTFGNMHKPHPGRYSIEETPTGFYAEAMTHANNPPAGHRVSGCTEPEIDRFLRSTWYLPFGRRFDMEYPSGIRHILISYATPIDDDRIQVVQFLYRNDREEDCPAQLLVDWDGKIVAEDQEVLESTDPDVTLDISRKVEMHMPSDRPSLIIRRRLMELLQEHEQKEVTAAYS
jgi:phenylpropionate dioxygenase-like ring-hydroxylating dioxygenase large terminal subunit